MHFEFEGVEHIKKHTRFVVYAVLTGVGVAGTLLIIAMRKPPEDLTQSAINE